jgi:hypothetical protein
VDGAQVHPRDSSGGGGPGSGGPGSGCHLGPIRIL